MSRFWSALGLSVTLHTAALGAITVGSAFEPPTLPAATPDHAAAGGIEVGRWTPVEPFTLPVEVEPAMGVEPLPPGTKAIAPKTSPQSAPARTEGVARERARVLPGAGVEEPVVPNTEPNIPINAGMVHDADPTVDRDALHQAMLAAASHPSPGAYEFTQPVMRVDPHEKNLDRAFARAFAAAFAADRSFFTSVPVGKARFVIELHDDGRIHQVLWPEPGAPVRLVELIQRMVKLLSVNHFSLQNSDDDSPTQRAFEMTVTQSHATGPKEVSAVDGQAGDIWMLGAGDTPTVGHPSRPAVADATGHKISCELKIVVPVPNIP